MRKEFLTDAEAPEGYVPPAAKKTRVLPPRPEDLEKMKQPAPEVTIYTNRADVPEHLRGNVPPEPQRLGKIPPNEMAAAIAKRMEARAEKRREKARKELDDPYRKRVLRGFHDLYNKRHGEVPAASEEVKSASEETKPSGPAKQGSSKRVRVDAEGASSAQE